MSGDKNDFKNERLLKICHLNVYQAIIPIKKDILNTVETKRMSKQEFYSLTQVTRLLEVTCICKHFKNSREIFYVRRRRIMHPVCIRNRIQSLDGNGKLFLNCYIQPQLFRYNFRNRKTPSYKIPQKLSRLRSFEYVRPKYPTSNSVYDKDPQ